MENIIQSRFSGKDVVKNAPKEEFVSVMQLKIPEIIPIKARGRGREGKSIRLINNVSTLRGKFFWLGGVPKESFWTSQTRDLNFQNLRNNIRRK